MAKVIADILDADTVKFNHLIESWENRTGRRAHDLSLYSDLRSRATSAIKELGLDPTDTITGELYFALQERARQDNQWLAKKIDVLPEDKPEVVLEKVIKWVERQSLNLEVWVCKSSVLKAMLSKQPPKTLMKSLGLRSVDSMLKRNNIAEITILALEMETPEWCNKFRSLYKKCKTADFDTKKVQIFELDKPRVEKIKKAGFPVNRLVTPNYESGSMLVVPFTNRFPLDVLACVVSLSETVYEIRKHSSLYRTFSVRKDFAQQFYNIAQQGITNASLGVSDIGWNSLHRHLVGNEYVISKLEQPHVTSEDLTAESALDLLLRQDERFKHWKNLEYTIYTHKNGYPVSLNLVDVVLNASNKSPHSRASLSYGRMRLWEELWARYLRSDDVVEDVISSYLRT